MTIKSNKNNFKWNELFTENIFIKISEEHCQCNSYRNMKCKCDVWILYFSDKEKPKILDFWSVYECVYLSNGKFFFVKNTWKLQTNPIAPIGWGNSRVSFATLFEYPNSLNWAAPINSQTHNTYRHKKH